MEQIELKSQSNFCDSNVNTSTALNINEPNDSVLNQSINQSILTENEPLLDTFSSSKDLETFTYKTSKLISSFSILQRINILIDHAKNSFNQGETIFKRKEPLFTLKSIDFFTRIIEKKLYDVNFALKSYFELVLIYESISELTQDKEVLVKLINVIVQVIKFIDNFSITNLLEYRLQILIKKVLVLNTNNSDNIKNALSPLLINEENNESKKKLVNF